MIKTITTLISLLICSGTHGQFSPDDILGNWETKDGKAHIQIFKYNGAKYGGKIVWLKEPYDENGQLKKDKNNPDISKRDKPLIGLMNIYGFSFKDGEFSDGLIYDPKSGKTYKCILKLENKNTLKVRGYIGFSMIGRTEEWKRID